MGVKYQDRREDPAKDILRDILIELKKLTKILDRIWRHMDVGL